MTGGTSTPRCVVEFVAGGGLERIGTFWPSLPGATMPRFSTSASGGLGRSLCAPSSASALERWPT
eukprot:2736058-Alexandrium_andersonii.AAC.1